MRSQSKSAMVSRRCEWKKNNKRDFNNEFSFASLAGLDKIEFLQSHQNIEIYQKVFDIIDQYFNSEEEDARVAPQSDGNQYQFNPDPSAVPMSGYEF